MQRIERLDHNHSADLLLVNTPLIDYVDHDRAYSAEDLLPPLGLGYIATEAASRGHNVGLIDAEALGTPVRELTGLINKLQPRYLGINALTPTMGVLTKILEQVDPKISVIIGGAHPTALPNDVLQLFSKNDRRVIVVRGEAEMVVGGILDESALANLPGTYWMDNRVAKHSLLRPDRATAYRDLDSAPRLDRKFLINEPTTDAHTGLYEARMMATRGCPFTCKFCSGARDALGQPLRRRQNEGVVEEIADLVRNDGVESIRLIDDLFMRSEAQVSSFLDSLEDHNVTVKFDFTSRVNIMTKFSPKIWDRLGERVHELTVGIEHGVKAVRDTAEKGILDEHIFNSIDMGCARGIKFKLYGILGLPGVSKVDESRSIQFFKDLITRHPQQIRASLFRFRPYPGTKYWDELLQAGWTQEQMLEMSGDESQTDDKRSRHSVITSASFGEASVEELTTMLLSFNDWQDDYLHAKP
ncbi:MAG: radical SAM protein [Candidatus Saccharibacteria bacterium]